MNTPIHFREGKKQLLKGEDSGPCISYAMSMTKWAANRPLPLWVYLSIYPATPLYEDFVQLRVCALLKQMKECDRRKSNDKNRRLATRAG